MAIPVRSMTTQHQAPAVGQTIRNWLSWLDGRTLAVLAALLTLGTMMQTAHTRLAADIEKVRDDLSADIEKLRDDVSGDIGKLRDDLSGDIGKVRGDLGADIKAIDNRLRAVEIDVAAIRTAVIGFDARNAKVEQQPRHLD